MNPDFEKLIEAEGSPIFDGLLAALKLPGITSLKINPSKGDVEDLPDGFIVGDAVPWEPNGYYLRERPAFTYDPALHQGLYYVQEASSMIHGEIVRRLGNSLGARPLRLLDACAAPGGKTTSLLIGAPDGSAVIANEYDFKRAEILKENLLKWGDANVAVTRGDTSRFRNVGPVFDIIVADMPCSGEGMFRKEPEALKQWSPALVEQCARLQREIAGNLLPSLAAGGYFIYSTCTFNTVENERNVEWLCDEFGLESVAMDWPAQWNIAEAVDSSVSAARFLPSRLQGEGLFVAVMRKPEGERSRALKEPKPLKKHPLKNWLHNGIDIYERQGEVWGAPPLLASLVEYLEKKGVKFISVGVPVATVKGKDVVPEHAFSQSVHYAAAFPEVEVSREEALAYLRRENLELNGRQPKGYLLLTYNGRPLGFVKNLGNRVNNLYPKEWRIRN